MAEYGWVYGFGHLRVTAEDWDQLQTTTQYGLCDHKFHRWIQDAGKEVRECYLHRRLRAGNDFRELNFVTPINPDYIWYISNKFRRTLAVVM